MQIASRINNYLVIVYSMLRICKARIKFASNARWHFVSRDPVCSFLDIPLILPQICAIVFLCFVTDLTFHFNERGKVNSAYLLIKVKHDNPRLVFIIVYTFIFMNKIDA